jgi:hypothetical protein
LDDVLPVGHHSGAGSPLEGCVLGEFAFSQVADFEIAAVASSSLLIRRPIAASPTNKASVGRFRTSRDDAAGITDGGRTGISRRTGGAPGGLIGIRTPINRR